MAARSPARKDLLKQPEWARYARWNLAVAQVVFSEAQAGLPVYLDLEDDVIARMADLVGEVAGDHADNLASAVAATIDRQGGASRLFINHRALVQQWERSEQVDHPPHLAFLAVLSLAAERMAEGDGMASNNYYGRLAPLLGLKTRRDDLALAYREVAEQWWAALNKWLENHDGRRGLPTAYSLGQQQQRYVGLPISQALVRAADRDGLVHFFQRVGFAPGTDTAPSTLLPLLDAWIGQNPSPASKSLQRMWSKHSTRDRVAEVAAVALAAWDGTVRMGTGAERSLESLRLTATIGGFLRPRLELGVLAYLEEPDEPRDVVITTAPSAPQVAAVPFAAGAMRLVGLQGVEPGSLLDGVLTISDPHTHRHVTRRPRRLIPLRHNDLLQALVESDQVQAGEDLVVLVDRALLPGLTSLLTEVARPGWVVVDDLQGTPDRWVVVRDVQVLKGPAADPAADLRALVPLTRMSLVLSGGYALPGRLRRWHSSQPPEIRALDDQGRALCVRLTSLALDLDDGSEAIESQWVSTTPGALVVDLEEADLPDGDYRVELFRVNEVEPATSLVLRLRSADVPDRLQWERVRSLGHRPDVPLSCLTAVPVTGTGPWVQGAVSPRWRSSDGEREGLGTVPAVPGWRRRPHGAVGRSRAWELAAPDAGSCMFSGAHRFVVPEDRGGRPTFSFIPVACTGCGVVKRMATTAWAARKRDSGKSCVPQLDVRALPAVRTERTDLWEVALDALGYFGGGEWGLLEKVALQVEASALFVDQFARTLEALGHIEVDRDPNTLEPVGWEISPTSLVGAAHDRWFLVGYWPASAVSDLEELIDAHGGALYGVATAEGPSASYVQMPAGVSLPDLSALEGLAVLPEASRVVATALCDLSLVIRRLPRRSADLSGEIKKFLPSEARWAPVGDLGGAGAYRVQRWATTDVIRTSSDVQAGTAARSTVQLSKHAAALESHHLLLAYDHKKRELSVPLGADLPGLYGRVATLASGLPPVADRSTHRLVYTDVPAEVAAVLARRLSH